MFYKHYNINIGDFKENFKIIIGVDTMRKKAAVSLALIILLASVSCQSNPNKKIQQNEQLPKVEENIQKPQPADSREDQKLSEKTESQKNEDIKKEDDKKDEVKDDITDIGTIPSTLSNNKIASWMPARNTEHKVPKMSPTYKNLLDKYGGYFTGDTESKTVYLTFDEGYENGYSGKILDILKEHGVKAAFFVTKPYIKDEPELVRRMVAEGHIVGNHTDRHPSMPDVSNDRVIKEIKDTADYFREVTGTSMPKFLRPPMGEWSERTLYITNAMGYKTILWSMAHRDWVANDQPSREATLKFINTYYHNGAIILLHAVSKSNTEAMGDIIESLQDKGYRFAPLTELK